MPLTSEEKQYINSLIDGVQAEPSSRSVQGYPKESLSAANYGDLYAGYEPGDPNLNPAGIQQHAGYGEVQRPTTTQQPQQPQQQPNIQQFLQSISGGCGCSGSGS